MKPNTIRVTHVEGEFMIFKVKSSNPSIPDYTVDMMAFMGNGACSCPDFEIRRKYNANRACEQKHAITMGVNIPDDKKMLLFSNQTQCKHIQAVMKYIAMNAMKSIYQQYKHHDCEEYSGNQRKAS